MYGGLLYLDSAGSTKGIPTIGGDDLTGNDLYAFRNKNAYSMLSLLQQIVHL